MKAESSRWMMLAGRLRALGVPWMCVTPRFENTPLALPPWFSMKAKVANDPTGEGTPTAPRPPSEPWPAGEAEE